MIFKRKTAAKVISAFALLFLYVSGFFFCPLRYAEVSASLDAVIDDAALVMMQ